MSDHTPGPWGLCASARAIKVYPINELGIQPTIAKIEKMPREAVNESQANARLIAAAPDMLEALKQFSNYVMKEQCSTDGPVTYSTTTINHFAFLARAAIALATGSSL